MKKIIILLIIGMLVSTTLAVAQTTNHQTTPEQLTVHITTPTHKLQTTNQQDTHLIIELENSATYLATPGHPKLPQIIQTTELPFGATNIHVTITPGTTHTQHINNHIKPAQPLIPLTPEYQHIAATTTLKDESIYTMTTPYPTTTHTTTLSAGLNHNNDHVTILTIHYYPIRYTPATGTLHITNSADFTITYTPPQHTPFPEKATTDLLIIAPQKFQEALQPLITHKISKGINTTLITTESIYTDFTGVDKPEQIKYAIKNAIETLGIHSVLLVGGLNNVIMAKPRDDQNQGSKAWYVPVRYTNLYDNPKFPLTDEKSTIFDPGVISDLYYADIYDANGSFSSWDTNGDGTFFAWGKPDVENDTGIDMYPDVALGRLACTSLKEVKTLVNKIITYETTTYGSDWFKKMTVISGDGFLDQEDLNIQWDTAGLPTGTYTIHAQSTNPSDESGPIETINITIDKTIATNLTFNHNDDERITTFPGPPIAEIVTVSEGNILGNTDFTYVPGEGEAYCNEFYFWANMSYINEVLTIRGKSYDPKPYGNLSSIHIWVTNSNSDIVFEDWRNNTEMYYEGEYTTGEKALLGRGGALYYMPEDFERDIVWASNGKFTGQQDIIDAVTEGAGFLFFSGHGSPNVWSDHYPGVPGNRGGGSITGLQVTSLRPWAPFFTIPLFPMDTIKNQKKLPIAVIGGCHNSQFNVSMVYGLLDIMHYFFPRFPKLSMWCSGFPVPETFSWRLVRNPRGGAIASMGNTGLGYGMPGIDLTTGGGDSWITIEFFKQYGDDGLDILGQAYQQTLTSYLNTFDMTDLAAGHPKTVQQWVLLGDPTLKIGGYAE